MQTEFARLSLLPSVLVLSDLAAGRAGNPPLEVLEQAGFDRSDVEGYLQRRAARTARCGSTPCS
jgi:hypothetical protein